MLYPHNNGTMEQRWSLDLRTAEKKVRSGQVREVGWGRRVIPTFEFRPFFLEKDRIDAQGRDGWLQFMHLSEGEGIVISFC